MRSGSAFIGFIISAGFGFAIGFAARAGTDEVVKKAKPPGPEVELPKPAAKSDVYQVPIGSSHQRGPSDALVTIVEFSEFQCPFSKKVQPVLAKVVEKYGKDVRIVFKHLPMAFHLQAPLASEYALAAGAQGKFWELHDLMFENQQALAEAELDGYAKQVGLDPGKLAAFLATGEAKRTIVSDQDLARRLGATGTPTFFINGVRITGAQPLGNFEAIIDDQLAKARELVDRGVQREQVYAELTKDGWEDVPRGPRPQQAPTTRRRLHLVEGTPTRGGKQPLVTIVEFSDFQCPFCARVNPTLDELLQTYGDKVQVHFRNQPLDFHKRAVPAAKAALAAHAQGKFWEMHDKLFKNQHALSDQDFVSYAKALGLDLPRFEKDLASAEVGERISRDQKDAEQLGARATPTLFVNGIPIRGALPLPTFKAVIDQEIELANKLLTEGVKAGQLYDEIIKREGGKEVKIAMSPP
jgi:protein-disulfide isomerase